MLFRTRSFEKDTFPGNPRILFVGYSGSTHTHSWIKLLENTSINVRLFGLGGAPPEDFQTKTYVTGQVSEKLNRSCRKNLYPYSRLLQILKTGYALLALKSRSALVEKWLAQIIGKWKPDIIHTFGYYPAGKLHSNIRWKYNMKNTGKWVLQLRGGSDFHLSSSVCEEYPIFSPETADCDVLLTDNSFNIGRLQMMGFNLERIANLCPVPGTGGLDLSHLKEDVNHNTSYRRRILWPKAYESEWSKSLPVLEALECCWDRIQPCHIDITAMDEETLRWFRKLPNKIQDNSTIHFGRIERANLLEMMETARIVLIPSLVDGVPNVMYEAMVKGAFPIVSPLETIKTVVKHEKNVLFARNLYPIEIAEVLVQAMNDDVLVEKAVKENLELVRKYADRNMIRPKVISLYESLFSMKNLSFI